MTWYPPSRLSKVPGIKHLAYRLEKNATGLDLCFITCGIPRVMWKTKANRWCLYWRRANSGRSERWLSFEVHPNMNFSYSVRSDPWALYFPPRSKSKVYF